jgi:hypothetical protein
VSKNGEKINLLRPFNKNDEVNLADENKSSVGQVNFANNVPSQKSTFSIFG